MEWKDEMSLKDQRAIAVMRPLLPDADQILPYLRKIDKNRWYSNHGPLSAELEARVGARYRLPRENVVTVSNATLALSIGLKCSVSTSGYCLLPAWTFVGCGHAVNFSGLTPFLCDVSPETGTLTPDIARDAAQKCPGPVRAVVAVGLFGQPMELDGWEEFERDTGIKVIFDLAAGFDTFRPSVAPAIVSLHATKIFSAGEGALLITLDAGLAGEIRRSTNFGYRSNRISDRWGINAKMSEYSAAVALADLGSFGDKREKLMVRSKRYRAALADCQDATLQPGFGIDWTGTFLNVRLKKPVATEMIDRLAAKNIEARKWWGIGLHHHPAFQSAKRTSLAVTEQFGKSFLGLPLWPDLPFKDIDRVVAQLRSELART